MNPVNATALFVSAARSVLQCDPCDPLALAELCKLLPFFRQSVSCLVCGQLLSDPVSPVASPCQHSVCLGCKSQRMQVRPPCSWCKDPSRFEHNRQLSVLVSCYRRLCAYLANSPLAPHVAALDCPDLQEALTEGLELLQGEDEEEVVEEEEAKPSQDEAPPLKPVKEEPVCVNGHECNGLHNSNGEQSEEEGPLLLRSLDTPPQNGPIQSEPAPVILSQPQHGPAHCQRLFVQSQNTPVLAPFRCHRKRSRSESDSQKVAPVSLSVLKEEESNTPQSLNGAPPLRTGSTLILSKPPRKTDPSAPKKVCTKARQQGVPKPRALPHHLPHALTLSHPSSPSKPITLSSSKPVYRRASEKKGCKCGRATQNPSVLTCRGQRCPCYSNRKACLDCICRGCQNSYMANGEKKLEAFAVPEKALEQTRLTLGINLSSIATLTRNPASNTSGHTPIAPVTASFHEPRVFDWSAGLSTEEEF